MPTSRRPGRSAKLELLPVMNLVTILIPMLLAAAELAELAVVDSTVPAISDQPGPPSDAPPPLVLTVSSTGVAVDGVEGAAEARTDLRCAGDVCARVTDYPLAALTDALATAKDTRPDDDRVTILAGDDVPYGVLVAVMDAAREAPAGPGQPARELFPRVVMGGGAP
jgi:biopolymer transport protein ExbD